jgi:hypothetical protein
MTGLAILMLLFTMIISVAAIVFWIWTLIDCITNKRLTDTQKVVWVLVIFFIGLIGSLIYVFAGRSPKVYVPVQQPYYYPPQPVAQPRPVEASESYRPYQEGYRPQEPARTYQASEPVRAPENQQVSQQEQYEQMQISYPE